MGLKIEPEFIERKYPNAYRIIGEDVKALSDLQDRFLKISEQIKDGKFPSFTELGHDAFQMGYKLGTIGESLWIAHRKKAITHSDLGDLVFIHFDVDKVLPMLDKVGEELNNMLIEKLAKNVGKEKARAILGW